MTAVVAVFAGLAIGVAVILAMPWLVAVSVLPLAWYDRYLRRAAAWGRKR